MINHNSLENRLNAVKEGKSVPTPPINSIEIKQNMNNKTSEDYNLNSPEISYKHFFISEGYKLVNVLTASLLYGYGIRSIFSTDWIFIGTLGIGFLLNHTLTIILKLFKK